MEWNQNYNHPKFSWKEKYRYPSIHYLGGFLPGLTELGLLVSVCELLVLVGSSYQEDISVPNENMSVLCLEKRVGIPLPKPNVRIVLQASFSNQLDSTPAGLELIFFRAGQQQKTRITTSCCIFRGEKSFRHESFPQLWITVMSRKDFPLTSFCRPAPNPLNSAQWLFPWVDWSTSQRSRFLKHLAMPPFPSSDWKKRQKSCAVSRSSFLQTWFEMMMTLCCQKGEQHGNGRPN